MSSRHVKHLLTVVALTAISTTPIPAHSLQCRFDLPPYTYDLCPLLIAPDFSLSATLSSRHMHLHKDTETPPTLTTHAYDIDLGGEGLENDPTLPAAEQVIPFDPGEVLLACPNGTWICLKISNSRPTHPSEPRRILQIIPVAGNIMDSSTSDSTFSGDAQSPHIYSVNATARLFQREETGETVLPFVEITLNGGLYRSRPQRAVMFLRCDSSVSEPSEPTPDLFKHDISYPNPLFGSSEDPRLSQTDTHRFMWSTKYACPIKTKSQPPTPEQTKQPSEMPQEEDNVAPEVPLTDDGGMRPITKGGAAGMIVGSLFGLSVLWYGIHVIRVQRRKRHYASVSREPESPVQVSSFYFGVASFPALPSFITSLFRSVRRSRRRGNSGSWFRSEYDPLTAEEYEIQDADEEDGMIIDFQRQGLLKGNKGPMANGGYGSVR
ncbi:hypothetical protein K439DRAFT_1658951 [Ramaria rubella]|nr:hypothetical protein K439DRAFT_1658951 [Ramaria rubella]